MPELPEVEMVKRVIEPQLIGRKIITIQLNQESIVAYPEIPEFKQALLNNTIANMNRRTKRLSCRKAYSLNHGTGQ